MSIIISNKHTVNIINNKLNYIPLTSEKLSEKKSGLGRFFRYKKKNPLA